MKKSYIKLYIFISILLVLFLLNEFYLKILNRFYLSIFVLLLLIIFKIIFGFEKDKHRYRKEILIQVIIYILFFFLMYYLLGIIIGFTKTGNYFSLYGIKNFLFPIILYTIFKELLRYMMLVKSEMNKILIFCIVILFTLMDLTMSISTSDFSNSKGIFTFISLIVLPYLSQNIVCTFLSLNYGFKPNIIYLLIINLYMYIFPITPNPNEYLYSIIQFLMPIGLLYNIYSYMDKNKDIELTREYKNNKYYYLIIPTILVLILVYFTSGEFNYHSIAIVSGSMEPVISRGDVVISKKIKDESELKVGVILAYKHEGKIIVHRINKIIDTKDGLIIYTKGDYNKNIDSYKVKPDMAVGIINITIPLIGYPTVLLSELR